MERLNPDIVSGYRSNKVFPHEARDGVHEARDGVTPRGTAKISRSREYLQIIYDPDKQHLSSSKKACCGCSIWFAEARGERSTRDLEAAVNRNDG
jgi:hypothetical protein